jgi:hypothetical protein
LSFNDIDKFLRWFCASIGRQYWELCGIKREAGNKLN